MPNKKYPRTVMEIRRARSGSSWAQSAARIEVIVDCLTNYVVAETVTVDLAAAARAIDYCKRRAAGGKEDMAAETEMFRFLYAHGQSLDWVLWGDPTCMIARLADGTTSRQRPHLRLV